MIFDGKALAREIEEKVTAKVQMLGRKPRVVSVLVGDDPASMLYTKLKQLAAERVGVQFDVVKLDVRCQMREISETLDGYGNDDSVTGLMVQLPIPGLSGLALKEALVKIPLAKDVDGLLSEQSGVMPATVRAIMTILDSIVARSGLWTKDSFWQKQFVVVGARGVVGKPLVNYLTKRGAKVIEVEWDTRGPAKLIRQGGVVISCVGKRGIVTGEMVQDGLVALDVGSPRGDMTAEVYQKASVVLQSPGGVGPVTVACLMENAVSMV